MTIQAVSASSFSTLQRRAFALGIGCKYQNKPFKPPFPRLRLDFEHLDGSGRLSPVKQPLCGIAITLEGIHRRIGDRAAEA